MEPIRSVERLFSIRMRATWLSGIRILIKIVSNQGVLFAIIALIAAASGLYANGLKQMDPDFPAVWLLSAVVTLVLFQGGTRTFLREADLVFLLPAEPRLTGYFRSSYRYGSFWQAVQVLLVMVVGGPLYFWVPLGDPMSFAVTSVGLLLVKQWSYHVRWHRSMNKRRPWHTLMILLVLNFLLCYSLISREWVLLTIGVATAAVWTFIMLRRPKAGYPWQDLLEAEENALASWRAVANFFVDIPQIKQRIRERKWLQPVIQRIPGDWSRPYQFLYTRTFVRYSEYFGIFLRLILFVAVILLFIKSYWLAVGIYLAGLFLMAFQLPMLGSERKYPDLIRTYPLRAEDKGVGISRLAFVLLTVQSVLMIVPLVAAGHLRLITVLIIFLTGVVFSWLLSVNYVPTRFIVRESGGTEARK